MSGQWKTMPYAQGLDQSLRSNEWDRHALKVNDLILAEIAGTQEEPEHSIIRVIVEPVRGGVMNSVAWPGPNMIAGTTGKPSASGGLHGLYEAPLPGQQVLIGFPYGNPNDPYIIQKYPYNISHNPIYAGAYFLPLTSKYHGATDNILGHFSGSYLAFRGSPVPGAVELNAMTDLDILAGATVNIEAVAEIDISSPIIDFSADASFTITVGGLTISLDSASNTIDITGSATATINIKPGLGGTVNLGAAAAVACNNLPSCIFSGAPHSTSLDVKA